MLSAQGGAVGGMGSGRLMRTQTQFSSTRLEHCGACARGTPGRAWMGRTRQGSRSISGTGIHSLLPTCMQLSPGTACQALPCSLQALPNACHGSLSRDPRDPRRSSRAAGSRALAGLDTRGNATGPGTRGWQATTRFGPRYYIQSHPVLVSIRWEGYLTNPWPWLRNSPCGPGLITPTGGAQAEQRYHAPGWWYHPPSSQSAPPATQAARPSRHSPLSCPRRLHCLGGVQLKAVSVGRWAGGVGLEAGRGGIAGPHSPPARMALVDLLGDARPGDLGC